MGRCLQLEQVGRKVAAAQREYKLDLPLPHPAGSAVGKVQRDTGIGGVKVRSKWAARGKWMVIGMEVQEQAQVLMEMLKYKVGGGSEKVGFQLLEVFKDTRKLQDNLLTMVCSCMNTAN